MGTQNTRMATTKLIQDWVATHAEQRPDAPAVVELDRAFSYAQLDADSNRLAHALKRQGCNPGDRVCFLMPKGVTAFVSLFGILKADCIYVPLDTSSPAARLAKIVSSCDPKILLAAGPVSTLVSELLAVEGIPEDMPVAWLDEGLPPFAERTPPRFCASDLVAFSESPPDYRNRPESLAYILFTSGSTGMPKGVMISHYNVTRFIDWTQSYFKISPEERLSSHAPLHFDLSVIDIYAAFSAGAQLHLVPTELSLLPNKLVAFMRERKLTQWVSVPSLLSYIAKFDVVRQDDFPELKRLIWCGETFPTPALIHWMKRLPHVQFTNLYGPTEATCASSYYTIPACPNDDHAAIPIGVACDGEELLVLGDDMSPTPPGEKGNLYIGGVGLSAGYWQDAEKSLAAFVPDPRNSAHRIYRTGDLGSVGKDGLFYMHGRADFQIKSRGYRIELGEIEAALHGFKELREVAVVAMDTGGFEGATICCAYEPMEDIEVTSVQLRKRLEKILPAYMIPTRWMKYPKIPRNANDKIDRRLLANRFRPVTSLGSE